MTGARCGALTLALAAAVSCGGDATGPRSGVLQIRLASPNQGSDAAILFTLTGPAPPTSATAPAGLRVFHERLSAVTKFAVTGPLPAGTILTVAVEDVGRLGQYAAAIQQVAADDFALQPLSGYSLTVTR